MKENSKKIINFILILCILCFILLVFKVMSKNILEFDNVIYNALPYSSNMTLFMKSVTILGEEFVFIILAILAFMIFKNRLIRFSIPLNLAIIASLNALLKIVIRRPRPVGYRLIEVSGLSFPSGHSATSLAFYGFIIFLILKYCKNRNIKIISVFLLSILILLIGISRIYLGVHYASDVLGGFLFASIYLILYVKLFKYFEQKINI